jgi:hypothetical protein
VGCVRKALALRDLGCLAFNSDHGARATDTLGELAREQSEPAADIKYALPGTRCQTGERLLVQQAVEQREARLFVARGAVDVFLAWVRGYPLKADFNT